MSRVFLLLLFFLSAPAAAAAPDVNTVDPYEAEMAGFDLDEAGAEALRARLADDPGDHVARATLMAHEHRRTYADGGSREAAERAHELGAWFVREHPAAPPTRFVEPAPDMDPRGYVTLVGLWDGHLAADEVPLPVLLNAARFFIHTDAERSRAILTRAAEDHPEDPEPHRELGQAWGLKARHGGEAAKKAAAAAALSSYLAAERLAPADGGRSLDSEIAGMAWIAGDPETAETHARRLVDNEEPGWDAGNRVYDGNRILGHLALERGDVPAAVAFLDAAGASEGSPQLNSFGPELSLAQALLDAGETDAVLRHLEAVGRFWELERGKLAAWSEAVRAGRPVTLSRFGAH